MALFEFLMILVSVVIGLALSEVLMGAAGLLRNRSSVRFYWLHLLLQLGVFFALFQQWWESWDLAGLDTLSFGMALMTLFPCVVLLLIAHILFPRREEEADLESYYYQQSPVLWFLVLIGTVQGTFVNPVLRGDVVFEAANWSGLPATAICIVLMLTRNKNVHGALAPAMFLLIVLDTWLVNPTLTAR